ncbi:GtrA family protein [Caballeronia novacaledonica]|uniref:GtrA family protein n=1 Tax=Caballeronia novacaledonica TaxID=1544861 RepID=A0ACB5R040_9BURK|nr:GtrA family protein [Caballeronia novacaledonica]
MISQLLKFGVVGVIGFLVDAGMLYMLLWSSMGYLSGRCVSFLVAATTTWLINRRFTFTAGKHRSLPMEWLSYLLAMSAGGLVNFAAYQAVMSSFRYTAILPLCAVATGSIAGMIVNFVVAKWWVFRHPKKADLQH